MNHISIFPGQVAGFFLNFAIEGNAELYHRVFLKQNPGNSAHH